jgi:hypothetical protein
VTATVWRLLGESWPLTVPRARLRQHVGEPALLALERCRAVRSSSLAAGETYPCRCRSEPGCAMRLVDEGGLVAVCELAPVQCLDEAIADDDAVRCHVDAESLVPLLQRGLRVPVSRVEPRHGVLALGDRRVGQVEARFVLAPRPGRWVSDGWLQRSVDEDPDRVLVVLVFVPGAIPPAAPRRVRDTRVEWVALSEALDLESGSMDLARLWLAIAPGAELGPELWPRYVFTADPDRGRFTYAGRALPLDRRLQEARLLIELLRGGGEWVPRSYLISTLWPQAFEGKNRPSPDQVDRRLRQLKSALSAAFEELPPFDGAPVDPIENLRSGDDSAGGYRIAVKPDRILWLSRPA